MKKATLIIVFGLFITGCETTKIGYHEHYNKCMMVSKTTMQEIANCGKEKRITYLQNNNLKGSSIGNTYMAWVNLLAERVEKKEISDTDAKMMLLDRQKELSLSQLEREKKSRIDWGKVAEQFQTK